MNHFRHLVAALACSAALAFATGASAAAAVTTSVEAFDNGVLLPPATPSATTSTAGYASFNGGDAFLTFVSGSVGGSQTPGSPTVINASTTDLAQGGTDAHTLRILMTQSGLTGDASLFTPTFAFDALNGTGVTGSIGFYIGTSAYDLATPVSVVNYAGTTGTLPAATFSVPHAATFAETLVFQFNVPAKTPTGSFAAHASVSAVPEPASAGLLAVAGAGLLLRRRAARRL